MGYKSTEKEIVLTSDSNAAELVTVTGWKSRHGRFYGEDERSARYDGATHARCDCGNITEKHYTACKDCRHKADVERFNARPFQEWDGEQPVCTWDGDRYFFTIEDLLDYMVDEELKTIDLLLCDPEPVPEVNLEQWNQSIPEETRLEEYYPELVKKVEELNQYIRSLPPTMYYPGKIRTSYTWIADKDFTELVSL